MRLLVIPNQSFPPSHSGWINISARDYLKKDIPQSVSWNNEEIYKQRQLVTTLAKKLKINSPDDWYNVQFTSIVKNGASELLEKYNDSLCGLLTAVYPEYLLSHITHFLKNHLQNIRLHSCHSLHLRDINGTLNVLCQDTDLLVAFVVINDHLLRNWQQS